MTIAARYEFPYPRNVGTVAGIEKYLKQLHPALMAFQTLWAERLEIRLEALVLEGEPGWTGVGSNPFIGDYRVKDIRLDSDKKLVFLYDETPLGADTIYSTITSTPGVTDYAIRYIRLDADKKVIVVYNEDAGALAGDIRSNPGPGEYRVKYIRLDSSKNIVVVYNETAL